MGICANNRLLTGAAMAVPLAAVGAVLVVAEAQFQWRLIYALALAIGAYFLTVNLIPPVKELNLKAGLFGRDINKDTDKKVPEALGIVPATIYLLCIILLMPLNLGVFSDYSAALASICFMVFLGFADDVLNLRWRYKLFLPAMATLPLLLAYSGSTVVTLPMPMRGILGLGSALDFGFLYQAYMGFFAIFCTNSINIYAGINGLEAGQSFIIGLSVVLHAAVELVRGVDTATQTANFEFGLMVTLPFVAVTLGLLKFNFFPSMVFVGDTYTYFAGMALAVTGILGHFSKTLILLFAPQILNFLYSIPQLIGLKHCPRHRVPKLNKKTGLMEATDNFTLLNLALRLLGPMSERSLCLVLLAFQCFCTAVAFFVRYYVADMVY